PPGFKNPAHPRQRDFRHQRVERHERDREPHQLRREGIPLKRRKRGLVASWDLGVGGGCGHAAASTNGATAADQSAKSSSSPISSEKMPSASVTAKPKIRLPNWPWAADGLRSAAAR